MNMRTLRSLQANVAPTRLYPGSLLDAYQNRVVQSLWIGHRLSAMESLSIRSFLANGHTFHLYLYGPCENVPAGTIIKDGNDVLAASFIDKFRPDALAAFADMFRYRLLRMGIPWWVDLDTVCMRPFDFADDYVFASETTVDASYTMVDNGIIKIPVGSKLLDKLIEFCDQHHSEVGGKSSISLGPLLMNRFVRELELMPYVRPPKIFTPVQPWHGIIKSLIEPASGIELRESYAVHLWNSSWKFLDKDASYHPESIYEMLKRRYPL